MGMVYVAFIDRCLCTQDRGLARLDASMTTSFVLDRVEPPASCWTQTRRSASAEGGGLIHHSDRGSQYLSIRYSERLADAGIDTSVGSVGDSYDCEYAIAA